MGLAPHHESSRNYLLPTALGWWARRVSEEVVEMLGGENILKVQGHAWSAMMCLHWELKHGYTTTRSHVV